MSDAKFDQDATLRKWTEIYQAGSATSLDFLVIAFARWQHEQMAARIAARDEALTRFAAVEAEKNELLQENARLRYIIETAEKAIDPELARLRAEVLRLKHLDAWIEIHGLYTTAKERDEARAEVERLTRELIEAGGDFSELKLELESTNALLEAEGKRLGQYAAAIAHAKSHLGNISRTVGNPEEYALGVLEEIDRLMRGEGGEG